MKVKSASECRLRWERDECSSAKRAWAKSEDKTLLQLIKDNPDKVGGAFDGRASVCHAVPAVTMQFQDFAWYAAQLHQKLPNMPERRRIDVIVRYQRHLNKQRQKIKWTAADVWLTVLSRRPVAHLSEDRTNA